MNGETLPPDHGYPVRLIVPSWAGIASIKWVGAIEVSASPLFSPFNTQLYRLFGPDYPAEGAPITHHVVKRAFQLAWPKPTPPNRRTTVCLGTCWAGNARS